jgi:Na+/melibiose symporter-like transporter
MLQIFMPFFLQLTLNLKNNHDAVIAEVPLLLMATSFATSLILKRFSNHYERRPSYVIGTLLCSIGVAGNFSFEKLNLKAMYFLPQQYWYLIYGIALVLGVGTTTIRSVSVAMQVDLVDSSAHSGTYQPKYLFIRTFVLIQ